MDDMSHNDHQASDPHGGHTLSDMHGSHDRHAWLSVATLLRQRIPRHVGIRDASEETTY